MRSFYLRFLPCFLVTLCCWSAPVIGRDLEVCPTCECTTLSQAVTQAAECDRIVLKSGIHAASEVRIDKELELLGEPGAILDGGGKTILYIQHDNVIVRDLSLRNVATNYVEDRAAVKCHDSDFLELRNLVIRQAFFGILIEKSHYGSISGCDIQGEATQDNYLESSNGNAIHLWYCDRMEITDNHVRQHRDGIYFEFVEETVIRHNHSESNMRYGLHFMFSHGNRYEENTFRHNGAGVAVMYSSDVQMIRNRFIDNWGESSYGLLLKDITDSELRDNIFRSNTVGIHADNTSRLLIQHNRFHRNGYALRIMGNCTDNTFNANDFTENSFDVTTNARQNHNAFDGNYWDAYAGYDLNRDGRGDVAFRPVKLFTYVIAQSPAAIILMRSTFIDLLNLAEKVTPVLTPANLMDEEPLMKPANDHLTERL